MEVQITLLERRNLCLKNLRDVSKKYLLHLETKDIDNIHIFRKKREVLFSILLKIDEQITVDPSLHAKACTQEYVALLKEILAIDSEILNRIHLLKGELSLQMGALSQGRQILSAYHSKGKVIDLAEGNSNLNKKI